MRRSTVGLLLAASALCALLTGGARAAVVYDTAQIVSIPTVAPAQEYSFSTTTAQALTVTLTDFQTPAAFGSLQIAVTLGDTLVVSGAVDTTHTATLAVPAAIGNYTLHVIGTPDAVQGIGSFGITVAPTATPATLIAQFSGNLTTPLPPSTSVTSTLTTNFTSTIAGTYTATLTDDAFPAALSLVSALIINDGTQDIIPVGVPTQITLAASTSYQLLLAATAAATPGAGLYGVQITDPNGTVVYARTLPVGGVASASTVSNSNAQALTLKLTDFQYPAALASVATAVTSGGAAPLGELLTAGSVSLYAPAGSLDVWTYAAAGSEPGAYSAVLSGSSATLFSSTQVVNPASSSTQRTYAFAVTLPSAGSYQLSVTDFQFPATLQALSASIAQNGAVLSQNSTGVFSAAAGAAIVVVSATPPVSGDGVFDVSVTPSPTGTALLDQTQAVGGTFTSQTVTVAADGGYSIALSDLAFPGSFDSLAVLLSQGGKVLGSINESGSFAKTLTAGTYGLTFVATPGATGYGLYSLNIASAPPPVVTFKAGAASVTAYQSVSLTWSSTNATNCTAAGATGWSGTEPVSGTASVVVSADLNLTLTCTGPGGSAKSTVTVKAVPASSGGHGGGSMDPAWLGLLGALTLTRWRQRRPDEGGAGDQRSPR